MIKPKVLSKTFSKLNKTMYHGTSSKYYYDLSRGVDLSKCNRRTDFGKGFYLTSNFNQASKHAKNRSFKHQPLVFQYELDVALLKKFKGKNFYKMDKEWAKFVYSNRSFENFKTHNYDYVLGGVADGRIEDLIDEMDNLVIDDAVMSYFHESIAKYASYDQLSVHRQKLFDKEIIRLSNVLYAFNKGKEWNE